MTARRRVNFIITLKNQTQSFKFVQSLSAFFAKDFNFLDIQGHVLLNVYFSMIFSVRNDTYVIAIHLQDAQTTCF